MMTIKESTVNILKNARIYTNDPSHPWATDIAIAGERIVGLDREAQAWCAAPGAVQQDLEGALVLPGLMDAHVHLAWYAQSLQELNLRGLSREAMHQHIARRIADTPSGQWIRGRGWDQNIWEDNRFPTAKELDSVSPQHPGAFIAKNGHALVANTMAMQVAGITSKTPDPACGYIQRGPDGEPTGMFFEEARRLILDEIPSPSFEQVAVGLEMAQQQLLACGLTGVHDVDGGQTFAAYQALHRQGKLRVRVIKYIPCEALDGLLAVGLRSGYGDDWLRFGGLKLFADGALGSRTAAMFEGYEGEPENLGVLTLQPEELLDIARKAAAGGIAMAIHAIGDRANHLVLNALGAVQPLNPTLRHRIEHVQIMRPEDQRRMGALGIVASMQPVHAIHDIAMADRYWGDRTQYAYAWRSVLEAGAVLSFGTDAPVESFNPFLSLYAAVSRREESGAPGPEGWHPEQRLSLAQAINAYTQGVAYAGGAEDRLGMLASGYYADLVIPDRDIFTCPREALLETEVKRTMVGGIWQYGDV